MVDRPIQLLLKGWENEARVLDVLLASRVISPEQIVALRSNSGGQFAKDVMEMAVHHDLSFVALPRDEEILRQFWNVAQPVLPELVRMSAACLRFTAVSASSGSSARSV